MLKIIDLKVGNIGSVLKAIKHLGYEFEVATKPEELKGATKIILPGVGSFDTASERIHGFGFVSALNHYVKEKNIPFLGICVGMQLLAKEGHEGKISPGLGYIDATVNRLNDLDGEVIVPHMGWNNLKGISGKIFDQVNAESCVYFVHSYAMKVNSIENLNIVYTDYGEDVVAFVNIDNIYGAQFHPEKSQEVGLQFIRNFIELC